MNKFIEASGIIPPRHYYDPYPTEVIDMLFKECSQWIKESQGEIVYRGMTVEDRPAMVKKAVRKDRKPIDTPPQAHEAIIELISRLGFKANRNNSIFTSGNKNQARGYGEIYVIFPIGNYFYTWGPEIIDLYRLMSDGNLLPLFYDLPPREMEELHKIRGFTGDGDAPATIFQKRQFYMTAVINRKGKFNQETMFRNFGHKFSNRNLIDAIKSDVEIMIACDFYYALSLSLWNSIADEFQDRFYDNEDLI